MPTRIAAWAIYDVFTVKDGEQIFLAVVSDTQWAIFCDAFGFTDLKADRVRVEAARMKGKGIRAASIRHDVSVETHWEVAIASCRKTLGGFDILVNNAGIEESGILADFDVEVFRRMLDVNVTGAMLGLKHGLRAMRPGGSAGEGGAILNVSSLAALGAQPFLGPYGATKAAVERLTKAAAAEAASLGWGVRINCVYPGFINSGVGSKLATDLVQLGYVESAAAASRYFAQRSPLGRMGEPEDLVGAALFLCSDHARYITGGGLSVDGGASLG
jgi:NAD(P)-dependent dehydrogenase (short-subunit alcohol dehydrogenase family)